MNEQKTDDAVLLRIQNNIAEITLNRPDKLNAIHMPLLEGLIEHLHSAAESKTVRVIVLRGAGRAFCAGADRTEMIERSAREWEYIVDRFLDPIRIISGTTKPVVAVIHGDAVGGGLGLALACDFRIASTKARFCAPFIKLGLAGCDMAAGYFLPRLVGMGAAGDMMMTGRFVDAEEALQIRLIHRLAPPDALEDAAAKLVSELASAPPIAMAMTKRAIRKSVDVDMNIRFCDVLSQATKTLPFPASFETATRT